MDTKELLRKIRKLEIRTRGLTRQIFSGEYHSAFKGRGMTFSEVREYQIGDEVRSIDWNVTARFNDPFIKIYEEERELTVMLIIDVSGSEEFGSREKSKKDIALEIAAILAFSAVSNNDKVGAVFVSDRIERFIAPDKGRKHALVILREFIELEPKSRLTDLNEALRFFRNTQKKRSIAFVISDFFDDQEFIDGLKLSNRKHDMVAIRVTDHSERELPPLGLVQVYNAETGRKTWVNSSSQKVRDNYRAEYDRKEAALLRSFKSSGIDFVSVDTEENYILALMALFKHRA